ncbi:unnamed protein product [Arctogadus glacialis]
MMGEMNGERHTEGCVDQKALSHAAFMAASLLYLEVFNKRASNGKLTARTQAILLYLLSKSSSFHWYVVWLDFV